MNQLQFERSPYLRQHADNPVDWYPWGEESQEKARRENKPILISIGYSTCHWCHVMERESFTDREVADFMNAHFVNVKIDREERPDLDNLYSEACRLLARKAAYPMHVFLTPDLKPFWAGTYFPPEPASRLMSWFQALQYASYNFKENRAAVEQQADKTLARMQMEEGQLIAPAAVEKGQQKTIIAQLYKHFDAENGGFGTAPKFPNFTTLEYLLHHHFYHPDEELLKRISFSINKIVQGGIYDQLGGGLSRYTVDAKWRVPHFEKMLYDNALLVQVMTQLYRLKKRKKYKRIIGETLGFVAREMTSPEGGFYAALDADSDGGEGRYYTWEKSEIDAALGEDAPLFCAFFGVEEKGNWEGVNILYQPHDLFDFAEKRGYSKSRIKEKLEDLKKRLHKLRQQRPAPSCDKKILLNRNALMCSAYARAAAALGEKKYQKIAERNLDFLLQTFYHKKEKTLYRASYQSGESHIPATIPATLSDYALLISAILEVFQLNFRIDLLHLADQLTKQVIDRFSDKESPFFFESSASVQDLIFRRKDLQGEDYPSGNAVMVSNFQQLAILHGKASYQKKASEMLQALSATIAQKPLRYAAWAKCQLGEENGIAEIAVVGEAAFEKASEINQLFIPQKVLIASVKEKEGIPLLEKREKAGETWIYLCQNFTCLRPVREVEDLFN